MASNRINLSALVLIGLASCAGAHLRMEQERDRLESLSLEPPQELLTLHEEPLQYVFRILLGIVTPPSKSIEEEADEDPVFGVVWECWQEYALAEIRFCVRMRAAGVQPRQAFAALFFAHSRRTRVGAIEAQVVDWTGHEATTNAVTEVEVGCKRLAADLADLHLSQDLTPFARRLASCLVFDLDKSKAALAEGDIHEARQWLRDAGITFQSVGKLKDLELEASK